MAVAGDASPPVLDLGPRHREMVAAGMGLAWWAQRHPDRPAVTSVLGDRTFAQLNAAANRLARGLRSAGLVAGDGVALVCTNRPEFVETVMACLRAGLRLTTVNWHLTGPEAAYIATDCGASAVVADAALPAALLGPIASALPAAVRLAVGGAAEGFEPYAQAVGGHDGADLSDPVPGTQMLYTSGTTGRPKGVCRPDAVARALAMRPRRNVYDYAPEGGGDRHLCTGPLYHSAPLAFSLSVPLAFGAGVVMMGPWDAEGSLALVEQHRITHTHMVPTMFHRLLALPEEVRTRSDLSSLRNVIHGAAPCPVPVKRRMIEWLGPVLLEYYAATEGPGTLIDSAAWLARPGSVGRPAADGDVVVTDASGRPVPTGTVGTVHLRAPDSGRFSYHGAADTPGAAGPGSHYTLGDVGHLDGDGYLYLHDRSADVIISGGINIYPAEVDAVLLDHPAVADAAVVGMPDDEWGEVVLAVVEPAGTAVAGPGLAAELIALCRARLASYKCPRRVEFVDVLPRSDNGKISRRLLRDRYRDGPAG